MKKLPLAIIPILLIIVVVLLFTFVVPTDGDLISAKGDYYIGQAIGLFFIVFLFLDLKKFFKNKK